jgi:hypothetical protein
VNWRRRKRPAQPLPESAPRGTGRHFYHAGIEVRTAYEATFWPMSGDGILLVGDQSVTIATNHYIAPVIEP